MRWRPLVETAFEEAIADLDSDFSRPDIVTGATLVRDNIGDLLQQSIHAKRVRARSEIVPAVARPLSMTSATVAP